MNDTITDELILQCRQGRTDAFAALVRHCQHYAFSLAFRMLCDEDDAKDAAQESFIRMWKAFDRYDDRAKFTTWFYAIVTRVCIDRLRERKRDNRSVSLNDGEEITALLAHHDGLHRDVSNRELVSIIGTLTASLPETQRVVFVLRDLEDLSVIDVCRVTGLSAGSVKTNLHYARRTIRDMLKNKYQLTGDDI